MKGELHKYLVVKSNYSNKANPTTDYIVYADFASVGDENSYLKLCVYDGDAPNGYRIVIAFSDWETVEDLTLTSVKLADQK